MKLSSNLLEKSDLPGQVTLNHLSIGQMEFILLIYYYYYYYYYYHILKKNYHYYYYLFFALSVSLSYRLLGRFPFVRTDRPGHSLRNEDFTFNQNYPARSVKS